MKVCIASKNKPDTIKTHIYFRPENVMIFVEPQEVRKYQMFCSEYKIIDIQKNDMGLPYARNFILDYVKEDKFVMSDDDIYKLGIRNLEGRYDDIENPQEILDVIEKGLDQYWAYSIPREVFAYFINKESNNKMRFYKNTRVLMPFYGLNKKKLQENDIRYDENLKYDGIDITAHILMKSGNICADFKYCNLADMTAPGGYSKLRNSIAQDTILTVEYEEVSNKYGLEFIKVIRDKNKKIFSLYLNTKRISKKRDVMLKNYQSYMSKK